MHAKLALSSGENGRLIIVGDVHGCVLELAQLLKKVRFNKNRDKLVFVGDLCNKGPRSQQVQTAWLAFGQALLAALCLEPPKALPARLICYSSQLCLTHCLSVQTLQLAMALDAISVRGNHDDAALATYSNLQKHHASIKVLQHYGMSLTLSLCLSVPEPLTQIITPCKVQQQFGIIRATWRVCFSCETYVQCHALQTALQDATAKL